MKLLTFAPSILAVIILLLVSRKKKPKATAVAVTIGDSPRDRIVTLAQSYLQSWQDVGPEVRELIVRDLWENAVGNVLPNEPWSGAFVVGVVNQAVPGALVSSAKHTHYARAAFDGHGLYETLPAELVTDPRPGDIVIKPRPGGSETFDDLRVREFPAHGDIITSVEPASVVAIGGNKLGANILEEVYPRAPSGALAPPVLAVMRLKENA